MRKNEIERLNTALDYAKNAEQNRRQGFTITADEGRIAQVIENFATNAIKYTPIGGHIHCRWIESHISQNYILRMHEPVLYPLRDFIRAFSSFALITAPQFSLYARSMSGLAFSKSAAF